MRCCKCGKELIDNERICPVCNTKQIAKRKRINAFIISAIVITAVAFMYFLLPDFVVGPIDDVVVSLVSSFFAVPLFIVGLFKR